ncbi:MAG: carbohydrate ABC transporter permease [Brevibacterium sp.]|uniref:carbohydrate ABC transporter permease n=1 Tax=unclassified Brevibacterium TaxID=2614124 RepID=UPI001E5FEEBF|nr:MULTISPECIES: sugar ABC transporter permease [unclassified Brevibacterium]MCD1286297.1 glycerol-3-phosphate ABC transporter permease [Brevibacterium sp. CCUG 69071]MDK8433659.1 sugar ABC transporter permease [Brevibacterium sp. H-BE7]
MKAALTPSEVQDPPAQKAARHRRGVREWATFLAFLAPNVLLILAFIYYPLASNIYYSMLDWRLGAASADFVGLKNYLTLFTSPTGLDMWRVTLIFTISTVVISMAIGLLLALVLNRNIPGRTFARTAVFSPYVLSGVGVGMVWNFIFDPQIGLLSHVFAFFGANSPDWYLDKNLALVMVIVVYIWKNLGYCAVVYLAGLQSIPKDLLEAAAIDHAGPVRRFFTISFPLLGPTTFFLIITTILSSMQAFDILRIMTPTGHGTNTIVFELFLQGFGVYQRAGYSAAISVVLFLALFIITTVQMRFVERKVHYA